MDQYITHNLVRNKNESLLSLHQNELYQFNTVDTEFMNSNEFFILQPEPEYNLTNITSDTNMTEMEDKSFKEITSLALKDVKPKKYLCDLCNSIFYFTMELRKHKRSQHHILPKVYKCSKCNDSFNFEYNYKIHLYSHSKTITQCPECLQTFKRTTIFLKHLKIHQKNDSYQCDKCKMEFEFKEYYDWHLNDNNKNRNCSILTRLLKNKELIKSDKKIVSKKHVCPICGKKFQKPFFLRRHENIHFNIKPFECQECSAKFNQKNSLDRHKLVHTKEKPYECPQCNMRFSQRPNLLLHVKNVHSSSPSDKTKYPCPNCSCIFNKPNSLNRHITEKHKLLLSDEYSVTNVMVQLKSLLTVQNSQTENSDNTVQTQEKPKALQINLLEENPINKAATLETRDNHENAGKTIVKDDNKIIINLVKVIDTLNPNKEIKYKMVQQIIQNGIKWFRCSDCEKKFKLSYDLLRHLTIHNKERAFSCAICSKAFALKSTLKSHLKIHSQEKKYHCTICFLKFCSLKQLNDHISIHGQLKPFLCQLCGKCFRTSDKLRAHQQVHRPKDKRIQNIEKTLIPPIKLQIDNNESDLLERFNEKYQCLICGILLNTISHLRYHEKQHLNLKTFECTICYKKFSAKSSLNVHRKIHLTIRSMKCELCPSKFRNSSDLKRHAVVHSNERKFLCPYCSKLFKTKSTCIGHIKLHAREQFELFDQKDPINDNEFEENKLKLLKNSKEDDNIVQVENQEHSFILTNEKLDMNIPTDKINLNTFSELTENVIFFQQDNKDSIKSNLIFMDNSNISSQLPTINSNKTSIPNNLLEKEKFINLQDIPKIKNKRFKDNFTIKSIENESQSDNILNYNSNSSYFNVKNILKKNIFVCEYCEKIFKKPIDYRRHIRSHTKDKPFLCQICNKSFSLKCSLNNHLKIHDKIRQTYNCIVCNKKYASKSVLNTHLRLHTGEMPYECDKCLKKFRTLGHRSAHICHKYKT